VRPTGAGHLEPGQYKIDRDFVNDITAQVKKGKLSDSASAPAFPFGKESRVLKSSGIMKGMQSPLNAYVNPVGPGSYRPIDQLAAHQRVTCPSSLAYSQRKGEPAENIREKKLQGRAPAPGNYDLPSFFDDIDKQRQEPLESGGRRPVLKTPWKNQWGTMFRSIHASATSGAKSRMSSTH